MLPNDAVGSLAHSEIQYMRAVHASRGQEPREGDRKLIVHKQRHEACRIVWSA